MAMSCKPRVISIALAGAALALLASGCAPVDVGLGEAHHYDMAIQTIDPDPVYPEDGAKPGDNGDKAAQATKRYRTDKAKPVETMSVSSSGGSGGGPN
jgi:hypothetical protein